MGHLEEMVYQDLMALKVILEEMVCHRQENLDLKVILDLLVTLDIEVQKEHEEEGVMMDSQENQELNDNYVYKKIIFREKLVIKERIVSLVHQVFRDIQVQKEIWGVLVWKDLLVYLVNLEYQVFLEKKVINYIGFYITY